MNDLPRNFRCEATGEPCVETACKRGSRCVEAERAQLTAARPPEPRKPAKITGRKPAQLEPREMPMSWGQLWIPAGSGVRMCYRQVWHYAEVAHCGIFDDDRIYSPAEWARKIANGTSRNAWRDLEFRDPGSDRWIPAQTLRERAHERYNEGARAAEARGELYL